MTRGVLLFAQNNPQMDYVKLSVFAAKRIIEFLNVPVTLVTNSKDYLLSTYRDADKIFDNIVDIWEDTDQIKKFHDGSMYEKNLKWNNLSRSECFDISPYDETLVLDVDYVISSDNLNKVWDNKHDFLIYRKSYDIAQWRDTSSFNYFNQHAVPFYWATAFYFKKTDNNRYFFRLVKHIKENWSYYRILYLIDAPTFRNDFAFSIAIHVMNGSIDNFSFGSLPGKMYYALDKDILVSIKDSSVQVLVEKEKYHGEYTLAKTKNLDIHIMNKFSLSRFIDGVNNV